MKTQKEIEDIGAIFVKNLILTSTNFEEDSGAYRSKFNMNMNAFIAGYIAANQHDAFLPRFQQFIDERILLSSTDESKSAYIICKQVVIDLYNT